MLCSLNTTSLAWAASRSALTVYPRLQYDFNPLCLKLLICLFFVALQATPFI